jgi:hypothetical protein
MMKVLRGATLFGVLIALGCDGFVGKTPVPIHSTASAVGTALDRARAILRHPDPGATIGEISLAGYSFSRELNIGGGYT